METSSKIRGDIGAVAELWVHWALRQEHGDTGYQASRGCTLFGAV